LLGVVVVVGLNCVVHLGKSSTSDGPDEKNGVVKLESFKVYSQYHLIWFRVLQKQLAFRVHDPYGDHAPFII